MAEPGDDGASNEAPAPVADASRPRRRELTKRQRRRRRRHGSSGPARHARPARSTRTGDRSGSRSRGRLVLGVALVIVGVMSLLAAFTGVFDEVLGRAIDLVAPEETPVDTAFADGDRQPSLALVTYDEDDPSGQASGLLVLAHDRETGEGTILLVPTATATDVPGYGTFQLREAFALGGASLVDVSLANLLGLRFDGAASLSDEDWASLLDRVGGFEVTVRSRVEPDGSSPGLEPGAQFLGGAELARYLTARGETETELERLPRVQDVMLGLLERVAAEPQVLDEVFEDGAPMLDIEDPQLVRTLLEELAVAHTAGRVTTLTLPVATLGSGREDSYRLDAERAEALVGDRLAASRPSEGAGAGRGVQILNGNGVPAIGQRVAERLGDGGYRIVLTGNADTFDYTTTRIVIYDDTDEQLAVARDVRDRLGVGEIQRSATTQSVVDVTIVVGADFPG